MIVDGKGMRTFVRELDDGALDGERGTWLQPLVHVLAYHAALILLDEEHKLALVFRLRDRCIRADDRVALLVERHVIGAFRRADDDERSDGRERRAAVWELEDEARGVVVVRLDCLSFRSRKRSGSRADFSGFDFVVGTVEVVEKDAAEPPR
jgi:hypothetical protein